MSRGYRCKHALRAMRAYVALGMVFTLTAYPSQAARAAPAGDPLEGYWLGTAGSAKEKIDVGFEIRRDASGKLAVRLTEPIANYFGMEVGEIKRDGEHVTSEALALSMALKDDALTGTYPGPNSPATLHRVDKLPQEPPVPDLPTGPAPRWETRLSGQAFAAPVVADGVAYIGTTGGVLNAVETAKGAITWTFSAGAPIFGAAAVQGDAVYFVCDNGFLYRLDRANGKERWHYDLGDAAVSRVLPHPTAFDWDWQGPQPVLADDVVYVGSGDGSFHAVDASSGQRKWRFETRGKIRVGAAIDGSRVVFGSGDHFVYSLDRATGKEIWRADTKADVDGAPLVDGGRVFVGNRGPGLFALDAVSGKELWRLFFWGSWVESTPVIRDGVLYIGSSDLARVSAVNPSDGHVIWRSNVYGWTWGTPVVTADRLYAGVSGGTPYFIKHVAGFATIDRKTGRVLTRWPIADTGGHQWGIAGSPAQSGDAVIVATVAGSLLAFPMQ